MSELSEQLKLVDFLSQAPDDRLEWLAEQSRELQFRKNTVLMTEGETGETMYLVLTGLIKVYVSDDNGKELILYEQGPGSVIGDIALLDDAPRSASVSTLENTTVLAIGKASFMQCLHDSPEMALSVIRSLTQRLREATEGSRRLALDNVYRRLADKLQELSVETEDARKLPKKYSHQELGNMIGASREMVGKVMAELVKGEYVDTRDGLLHILKKFPRNW